MVITRIDGKPITFPGQKVSYGSGIQNTINKRIFTDTSQRVITVPNPNPIANYPTTDYFYDNLATGALPRRDKTNTVDNKVKVNSTNGVYSPNL